MDRSPSFISGVERGLFEVSPSDIRRLCRILPNYKEIEMLRESGQMARAVIEEVATRPTAYPIFAAVFELSDEELEELTEADVLDVLRNLAAAKLQGRLDI